MSDVQTRRRPPVRARELSAKAKEAALPPPTTRKRRLTKKPAKGVSNSQLSEPTAAAAELLLGLRQKEPELEPEDEPSEHSSDLDRGTAGATQRRLNASRSIYIDDELPERDNEGDFEGNKQPEEFFHSQIRRTPSLSGMPLPEPPNRSFEYIIQTELLFDDGRKKTQVNAKPWKERSAALDVSVERRIKDWFQSEVAGKYALVSIALVAKAAGVRNVLKGGVTDLQTLKDCLQDWSDHGKTGLTIEATGTAVALPKPTVPVTPAPTPASRSTTAVMLANQPAERAAMEVDGNHALSLIERWPCKFNGCPNYGHTCFVQGRDDDKSSHYPIPNPIAYAWSSAVARGDVTVDEPAAHFMKALMEAKWRKRKSSELSSPSKVDVKRDTGGNVVNVYYGDSKKKRRRALSIPSSSPVRDVSPESLSDPVDVMSDFFDWLADKPAWRKKERATTLKGMREMFVELQYTLDGLAAMDLKVWLDKGLVEGP